jgi:hypothetical protein
MLVPSRLLPWEVPAVANTLMHAKALQSSLQNNHDTHDCGYHGPFGHAGEIENH